MFLFLLYPLFNVSFKSLLCHSLPLVLLHFPVPKFERIAYLGFGPSFAGCDVSPLRCTLESLDAAPARVSLCGPDEVRAMDSCIPCTPACLPLPDTPLGTPGGTRHAVSRSHNALACQPTHFESPESMRSLPCWAQSQF